jgi:dolichyl-diphosphooligosaccharide---protein glycosyltransferase
MSKAPKRGKLRNPPKGRRYAYMAIVGVLIVAGISGIYVYGLKLQAASTSTSSEGFSNPPCTSPSSTSSSSTANGTYALICTNLGLITAQLFPAQAPKTVANFVSLADSGFYNDLVWHRIVPGFVIQIGDPNTKDGGGNRSTWGQGTSGTNIPFENSSLSNTVGTLAMASTQAGVGGSSQFYINLADNAQSLDGKYAVFGQVISGMSVVDALAKVPLVDATSCASDSPTATACEPANASSAYIVSVTIQSTP